MEKQKYCNCGHLKENHHEVEGNPTWCYEEDCNCIEYKALEEKGDNKREEQ